MYYNIKYSITWPFDKYIRSKCGHWIAVRRRVYVLDWKTEVAAWHRNYHGTKRQLSSSVYASRQETNIVIFAAAVVDDVRLVYRQSVCKSGIRESTCSTRLLVIVILIYVSLRQTKHTLQCRNRAHSKRLSALIFMLRWFISHHFLEHGVIMFTGDNLPYKHVFNLYYD